MRILTFLCAFLLCVSPSFTQTDLTAEEWKEDLDFLRQTVHADYDHLFRKISADDWDAAAERLERGIPDMENHQVIVGLVKLVALFGYGHTYLDATSWRYSRNATGFQQMPYNLYQFSDGVYVQGVHKDFEQALGAKVLKVGNLSIEDALEAIRPVVSIENEPFFKAYGLYNLGVPEVLETQGVIDETQSVTLLLEKDDRQFEVEFTHRASVHFPGKYGLIQTHEDWLDARDQSQTPLWLKHLDKIYYYEYLPEEKTVYVRHSQIQDDPSEMIPEFYDQVFGFIEGNDVERLILDVRLNGGGNNFKNKPIITGVIRTDKINQPGKFIVIIGRRTYSACQNLVNRLENYTEVTFVGEPTAENVNFYGDNQTVRLPNSELPIRLSYLWWQDKDPRDNRPFTPPHVAVDLSFDDYVHNRDPVLEAALAHQSEGGIIDPWVHLTDLFNQGKFDELEKKAHAFVKDPRYKYFDFEERINDAGYQLMGADMTEQALMAFQLNADLFPESANCWDSLAEAYWKSGDIPKAKELYQKAISLDPEGPIGENARNMLKQIEEENRK